MQVLKKDTSRGKNLSRKTPLAEIFFRGLCLPRLVFSAEKFRAEGDDSWLNVTFVNLIMDST